MTLALQFVVDRISAKVGRSGEGPFGIDAAHSDICKLSGDPREGTYDLIMGHLTELGRSFRISFYPS